MKKNFLLMSVVFTWTVSLTAQITQKEADEIVLNYLGNEVPQQDLYVNTGTPATGDFSLTTSNGETIKAKYACWVYYLKESDLSQSRYLFVKAGDGNLLEVVASNDVGPNDLSTAWTAVKGSGLTEIGANAKLLYPNPVSDWLTISYNGESARVEIYDLKGTRLFSGLLTDKRLNVSFLSAGTYMVNVDGESYKIIKN